MLKGTLNNNKIIFTCEHCLFTTGAIIGLLADITGILVVAETQYEDGLSHFLVNTSTDYSLLGGIGSGLVVSIITAVTVSLCTHNIHSKGDAEYQWKRTLAIDNPLHPWRHHYKKELSNVSLSTLITSSHMEQVFKRAKTIAVTGGVVNLIFFLAVLPGVVLSFEVLTFDQFHGWITTCQVWCMAGATFAILAPPLEEIYQILRHSRHINYETSMNIDDDIEL